MSAPLPGTSLAERKTAAGRLLAEHPDWSTRRVAVAAGLAPGTVARLRGPALATEVRVGRDGHRRALDGDQRRRLAGEILAAEPGISLRQAARRAGISPTTVRVVRDRLRQAGGPPAPRTVEPERAPARPAGRALLDLLRTDPALRHTVSGRRILTGLTAGNLDQLNLAALARALPAHCVDLVAVAATDCSRAWQQLADTIERQRRGDPPGRHDRPRGCGDAGSVPPSLSS